MVSQKLQTSKPGNKKAKKAFLRNHLTEVELAVNLGLNSSTIVEQFFKGESIERYIFQKICLCLGLNWEEIYALDPDDVQNHNLKIDRLVHEVRAMVYEKIEKYCGTIRFLARSKSIIFDGIEPQVHILKSTLHNRNLDVTQLQDNLTKENFERLGLGYISEPRISGLNAMDRYSKVMIVGQTGSGKTTFLKYLANQCNVGHFHDGLVPIFIPLKEFSQVPGNPSLLEYMTQVYGPLSQDNTKFTTNFKELLDNGRVMILLDGLDEVTQTSKNRVLKHVREFTEKFHNNQFAITCRITLPEYALEKFVEIQMAELELEQMIALARQWFLQSDRAKVDSFVQHLQNNPSIQTIAANPLSLILLCLVFEENSYFPTNYVELYKQGVAILLNQWDDRRCIEGDWAYRNLSVEQRQDLLERIALSNFNRSEYFVKQSDLVQYIQDYISQSSTSDISSIGLQQQSEIVLKSIETQHGFLVERTPGLFSFYHPAFQYYFTAQAIVKSKNSQSWFNLVNCVTKPAWREVFLLASELMSNSDDLLQLMKTHIDRLLASDRTLQQFLNWAYEKSLSVRVSFKPSAVRSFYLALFPNLNSIRTDLELDLKLTHACDPAFNLAVERFLHLDYLLVLGFARALAPTLTRDLALTLAYVQARVRVLAFDFPIDPEFEESLANLKKELTQSDRTMKTNIEDGQMNPQVWTERLQMARKWWQANRLAWTEKLKKVMLRYRNIGHHWQFTYQQERLLKDYYYANELLIDCLNRANFVSDGVREEIEATLLLPIAEIEKRNKRNI